MCHVAQLRAPAGTCSAAAVSAPRMTDTPSRRCETSEYTVGMSCVLIELDIGNTVGFFSTERAALDDVVD